MGGVRADAALATNKFDLISDVVGRLLKFVHGCLTLSSGSGVELLPAEMGRNCPRALLGNRIGAE